MNKSKIDRMRELNNILAKAADAYYNTGVEIMSDCEYDILYDELSALETETGVILSGSRTQKVGYEVSSSLKKVKHTSKMLSLDKTKSVDELIGWLGDNTGFLSWKLDGLTIVLTYENGKLVQAVTRGMVKQVKILLQTPVILSAFLPSFPLLINLLSVAKLL